MTDEELDDWLEMQPPLETRARRCQLSSAMSDEMNFPCGDDYIPTARLEFQAFYSTATAGDAVLMDVLLQTHADLNLLIKEPRTPANPLRDQLERVTDATERAFTEAREAVRGCLTFRALCAGDQRRIEAVLFEVYPPWAT